MVQTIHIYPDKGDTINATYVKTVISTLFKLTRQEATVLANMVMASDTDPAHNRKQARIDSNIKSAEGFNNIFSTLKRKGVIVKGDDTKYAYAKGVILTDNTDMIQFKFMHNESGTQATDNQ